MGQDFRADETLCACVSAGDRLLGNGLLAALDLHIQESGGVF
jgi:hypothetical protein